MQSINEMQEEIIKLKSTVNNLQKIIAEIITCELAPNCSNKFPTCKYLPITSQLVETDKDGYLFLKEKYLFLKEKRQ